MKSIILLISLFFSVLTNAQDEMLALLPTKEFTFYLGWNYTFNKSFRFLSEGRDANAGTSSTISERNMIEHSLYSHGGGIFTGYRVSKQFSIEGGVGYSSFGQSEKKKEIIAIGMAPGLDEVIGWKHNSSQLHIISVPVSFRLYFGTRRLRPLISAGVSTAMAMRYVKTTRYEYTNGLKNKFHSYSKDELKHSFSTFHLIGQFSTGVDIHVSSDVTVRLAPKFQITTNSIYAPKEIRGNYYNLGIEIGAVYDL